MHQGTASFPVLLKSDGSSTFGSIINESEDESEDWESMDENEEWENDASSE
jgi:hypothetical protein